MSASFGYRCACVLVVAAIALNSKQSFAEDEQEPDWLDFTFCTDMADAESLDEEPSKSVSEAFAFPEAPTYEEDVDYEFECCEPSEVCCDSYCEPCCDTTPWRHRTGVWGQFLYLHAVDADMHHAQQQNGTGGAGTTPFGVIGVADPDAEPGIKVGGQFALDPCSSVGVSYTFFESSAISSIGPPSGVGGGLGTVGSLVHHPAADITGSAGPVDATYDLEMQFIDAEFRRSAFHTNRAWANWSLGARYGRLEQNFSQNGNYAGSLGGDIDTSTEIDFDGYGLRLGIDGEHLVGCYGVSVYGNAAFSALFGSFRSDYLMTNATTVSDLAISRYEDDRSAPMLEYEIGMAWTSCTGCCKAKVGYTAIHWYDVVTTPEFVDAVQADNYTDVGSTLSFQGLTSSIEWRY